MTTIRVQGKPLYQWDTDRRVIIEPGNGVTIDDVHFSVDGENSLGVEHAADENGIVSAPIPNILLQSGSNITVYACMATDNGQHTIASRIVSVINRAKPADYVYTEIEVKSYAALKKKLSEKLPANQGAENAGKALVIDDDGNVVPGEVQGSGGDGAGIDITGAAAGQVAQIAEVDENGVPTAWQPADLPKVYDWAIAKLPFTEAQISNTASGAGFVVNPTNFADGKTYFRYHAGSTSFVWTNPNPQKGAVTITVLGWSQYADKATANGFSALNIAYADGTTGRLQLVNGQVVTMTTDAGKVLTQISGNYDHENWVLLDMDVLSIVADYPAPTGTVKSVNGNLPDEDGNVEIDIPEGGGGGIVYNAKTPPEGLTAAVGDGETDDAPALNALVTHINSIGGGILFLPKGTYMVDSRVYWKSNVSLVGEGIGLTILKPRQAAGVGVGFAAISWQGFTASSPMVNCTFRDFTIDGDEMNITSYTPWPKGINIHFIKDCVFRDMVIKNTCATGLGIDHLSNVVIDNIGCYNCGRSWSGSGTEANVGGAGLGIGTKRMNGEAVIIRNCICDGCGNYGIFLEDQGSASTDGESYIISNNIVKNGRNHGIVVKGGSRVIVANNTSFGNAKDGFAVLENNGFLSDIIKFSNNLSYENSNGFRLESNGACEDIFVSENVFSDNKNGVVINTATSDLEIMRNTIKNNNVGVSMASVQHTDCVFKDNIIFKNLSDYDIYATFAGDVTYNDIAKTDVTAIRFPHSTYNVTEGKTLTLRVDFEPAYATGNVVYESDSNDIATISGNVLSALAPGSVTVTAKCGTLTATCTVTVIEASEDEPVESENLWDSSIELTAGYIDANGVLNTKDSVDNLVCDSYIPTETGGAYAFNVDGVNMGTATWRIAEYDANHVFVQRKIAIPFGGIVKLNAETAFVKIGISCKVSLATDIQEHGHFARYIFATETLPAEYKQVESVTASGTQYIDTGIVPNQDTKVSIIAQNHIDYTGSSQMAWFGARIANGNDAFDVRNVGYVSYGDESHAEGTKTDIIITRMLDKNKYYEGGNLKHTFTYTMFSAGCNLLLCALNSGGSVVDVTRSKMSVFGCEIYDNDVLVRKFVPAKRIADNVYGLYDTCNGVFYESAVSSGFTA